VLKKMKIRFLGAHNCESLETRLVSLLVDDVLALDAGGLTSGLSFSAQLQLKAILLTHQHFDHIRDIPTLAMNFYLRRASINIYSIPPVFDDLKTYLLNDKLYPNFLERPARQPTLRFTALEPLKPVQIEGYSILAVPVSHSVPTVGYQITSHDGKALFFTGDTGPGLAGCWQQVSPQLLITEVTASNRLDDFMRESGHLTPNLLKQELIAFRRLKGYLPKVATVHMNPDTEAEIARELAAVAEELPATITLAHEGMELRL
jgi:ribonuclease BN (tRNA processing enzyme)